MAHVLVTQAQFNEIAAKFAPKMAKRPCEPCGGTGRITTLGIEARCKECEGTGCFWFQAEPPEAKGTFDTPLAKRGWQALCFVDNSTEFPEEWVIIPYMSIGTFEQAMEASRRTSLRNTALLTDQ